MGLFLASSRELLLPSPPVPSNASPNGYLPLPSVCCSGGQPSSLRGVSSPLVGGSPTGLQLEPTRKVPLGIEPSLFFENRAPIHYGTRPHLEGVEPSTSPLGQACSASLLYTLISLLSTTNFPAALTSYGWSYRTTSAFEAAFKRGGLPVVALQERLYFCPLCGVKVLKRVR